MAQLIITQTEDYTDGNPPIPANTDIILFDNPGTAQATFASNQFGGSGISNTVSLAANDRPNNIQVNLSATGTFSVAGWSFTGWNNNVDDVFLKGTSGDDTITGSSQNDFFLDVNGADHLVGGDGDDVFEIKAGATIAGAVLDGSSQTLSDTLQVTGTHNLSGVTIIGIERLEFGSAADITLDGTQVGAGALHIIRGSSSPQPQSLIVNGAIVDLSTVTFNFWGDANQTIAINGTNASSNTLVGSPERDRITGTGTSNDTIKGGGGADVLDGGAGNDVFKYTATDEVVLGEVIAGGADADEISLTDGSKDFSLATITDVESLRFDNGTLTATFSSAQFGPGAIVTVFAGIGADTLIVNSAGSVNLDLVTFIGWADGTDSITINGTSASEQLFGSTKSDVIIGGGGVDTLVGGDGDDVFRYGAPGDYVLGETLLGGNGIDTVEIAGGNYDFSPAPSFDSIDALRFIGTATVVMAGNQIGAPSTVAAVAGGTGTDTLIVNAVADVDLSDVNVTNWTDGVDTIAINGTTSGESLIGSSKNDIIVGGLGSDTTDGGDGDDVFRFAHSDSEDGELIDGGAGIDTLQIDGTNSFINGTVQSIERIVYTVGGASARFEADQFGAGLISNSLSLIGGAFSSSIRVNLAAATAFSAAGWTFSSWTDTLTSIVLVGTTGVDTIAGSSRADNIAGDGGADVLSGGDGNDLFLYSSASHAAPGEQVDGGDGVDSVLVAGSTMNLAAMALSSIEHLEFTLDLTTTTATLSATQIGVGAIAQVAGSVDSDHLVVIAASDVDLSGLTFSSWDNGTDTITINGTAAGETLTGSSRNDTISGGAGYDTAVLSGNRSSYILQVVDDALVISGLDGTDTLNGIERLQFADGTVNLEDGDPLFDTPFYLSQNADVFYAGVDALAHFNTFGFHEGRDPNALFDTAGYLAVNTDVAAAGVNPLEHFHQFGWKEGRDPSAGFDTRLYLINNPDVAAAHVDPLQHFLQHGLAEHRQAFAAIGQRISGGFDFEFYLLNNPDVAAAGIDALTHFNTVGWLEGRNPNAWFDTAGYLSHYTDVAAAGINPLQHYETVGWIEGRDPSATFDTLGYLAANADVAAAHTNPLDHFLKFGIYEGRAAINDGALF
jgi:Ca2+-binding RTX toxin-like protein